LQSRFTPLGHILNANQPGDFVAQFGVLNFTQVSNRFMGRVFKSPKSGHLLNMHYLHEMFPLEQVPADPKSKDKANPTFRANAYSEFMEMDVSTDPKSPDERESFLSSIFGSGTENEVDQAWIGDVNSPISPLTLNSARPVDSPGGIDAVLDGRPKASGPWKVKHFSRLWMYRNGESPPPDKDLVPTRATF
jgi:hypothetical protein